MRYEYQCDKCDKVQDVYKSMHDSSRAEACPDCSLKMSRIYTAPHITGAKVQDATYNVGLGKVVRNSRHEKDVCKRMGVTAIGNDYKDPATMHKEQDRHIEERRDASYEKAMKEIE